MSLLARIFKYSPIKLKLVSGSLGYSGDLALFENRYLSAIKGFSFVRNGGIETLDLACLHDYEDCYPDAPNKYWKLNFNASFGQASLTVGGSEEKVRELMNLAENIRSNHDTLIIRHPKTFISVNIRKVLVLLFPSLAVLALIIFKII